MALRFTKMQGAGNDFVVIDHRDGVSAPDRATMTWIADRHFGVGCDQILILEPPRCTASLASYRIVNADGSDAQQCGNGARCLAAWLHRDGSFVDHAVLDSPSGPVPVRRLIDDRFEAALSAPAFAATDLPMRDIEAGADGRYSLDIEGTTVQFGAVSMGNPHVVIEVDEVAEAPVPIAFALQQHPAFPESCNVGFAQVIARDHLHLRVIERGVGETLACGSGACAAHAWLRRSGRVDGETRIDLHGGTLGVVWSGSAHEPVRLSGPTAFVFEGTWNP
jgi:diaminopimelate epimerase